MSDCPPTYVLLPAPDMPGGIRVDTVTSHLERHLYRTVPPFDWRSATTKLVATTEVAIDVIEYGRGERLSRRERRQRARANGRRRAIPVPVETTWGIRIAAHPSVPARSVQDFAEARAVIVKRVWNRRRYLR